VPKGFNAYMADGPFWIVENGSTCGIRENAALHIESHFNTWAADGDLLDLILWASQNLSKMPRNLRNSFECWMQSCADDMPEYVARAQANYDEESRHD
jgi:hypothetical protein